MSYSPPSVVGHSPRSSPADTDRHPYRVTMIHPSVGLNWSGGSEIVAFELARHLSRDFEVELLCGAPCGSFSCPIACIPRTATYDLLQKPLLHALTHRLVTHPEVVTEHLTSFLPCVWHLLRRPPEIIFPHNDYGGLAVAALVRFFQKTPVIFTEHTGLLQEGKCLKRNLQFCPDHLVVLDQAGQDFVQAINPQQMTSVIPNGVDLERFVPTEGRLEFGLKGAVVLCVASLWRNGHKRIELAIEAIARLPEASLLLCGHGPDREYFQELGTRLLGAERFTIRSFPFEQMPLVYQSADVFTLPSRQEPFGLVYLEAMACGIPVVATDDPVRQYIVGDGGILCDVTHAAAYAAALKDALQGSWKQRARQNATRFSWEVIAAQYRQVILQTIEAKRN
jgi:glycosyltransferase involved in cell wall biosynthesis